MAFSDDRRRPAALNLTPVRSNSADSSSSTSSLAKPPRTPRFAEATSIHSPVEPKEAPFAQDKGAEPSDIGFGYIANNRESTANVPMTPRSPLKSAMRVPGTPARAFNNPLSPTFREEEMLEKREGMTEKQQAADLKVKTRVRLAKIALRGVNFSCSLIVLAMLSSTLSIFNATKGLAPQSNFPPWAVGTSSWPQLLVLSVACVSLTICILVFIGYCRGGHRRAEKVGVYYTLFAVGWFIVSMIMWAIAAGVFQSSKNNNNNKDMWGWSCVKNTRSQLFADKVDYELVCRLQNWSLICMIIEIVIEVISIILYSVVFYRYYTKRKLTKSMDMRDKARSDLYLAQLRSQSAPNTPGFGPKSPTFSQYGPKSPAFSQYAMSPRFPPAAYKSLDNIEEASPFTPGGRVPVPESTFNKPAEPSTKPFKLQAPPFKAPSATPKMSGNGFSPVDSTAPGLPSVTVSDHGPVAASEPTYDAVPIPGAYAGQAIKSPPPQQTNFNLR